jgi:pseudaminic acid biosynthesis-associated methylase
MGSMAERSGKRRRSVPKRADRNYRTKQEAFWAEEFGDAYTSRNRGTEIVAGNAALFSQMLRRTGKIRSAIEFGANRGLNLAALRLLVPDIKLAAVEINTKAVAELKKLPNLAIHHQSILDYKPRQSFELALSKGVLIHIHPDRLPEVYEILYKSSSRFIYLAEYYNPVPVSIPYRGHAERLFKRDFAGEMLKRYPKLRLLDYGFAYHGDPNFPQDDITWFLLEKTRER